MSMYEDDEEPDLYPQHGDTRLNKQWWECTERTDTGLWEDHWLWTGVPKVTRGHPQHREFMLMHPARETGPKGMRFRKVCDAFACVNPRHYEPVNHAYREPQSAWEEVDLGDWAQRYKDEIEGDETL